MNHSTSEVPTSDKKSWSYVSRQVSQFLAVIQTIIPRYTLLCFTMSELLSAFSNTVFVDGLADLLYLQNIGTFRMNVPTACSTTLQSLQGLLADAFPEGVWVSLTVFSLSMHNGRRNA
jgi:hypothetical protein